VWRVERGEGIRRAPVAEGTGGGEESVVVRRTTSPRDRFVASAPVPISPALPPVVPRPPEPVTAVRIPTAPAVPMPAASAVPYVPGRRRARDRYDWRVTRHVARPVENVEPPKHFLATFGWVAAWYAVPFAMFAAWSLTFPGNPGTACARPLDNACPSPRSLALTTLLHAVPQVGVALGISIVVAGLIRLGSAAWRPVTAGFSAAIIGAGIATVLYSVVSSSA
jgi:hypothetical protein